jgi:hypothetical protein
LSATSTGAAPTQYQRRIQVLGCFPQPADVKTRRTSRDCQPAWPRYSEVASKLNAISHCGSVPTLLQFMLKRLEETHSYEHVTQIRHARCHTRFSVTSLSRSFFRHHARSSMTSLSTGLIRHTRLFLTGSFVCSVSLWHTSLSAVSCKLAFRQSVAHTSECRFMQADVGWLWIAMQLCECGGDTVVFVVMGKWPWAGIHTSG